MNRNLKVTLAIIFTISISSMLAAAPGAFASSTQAGQASQARVQAALAKEVRHELAMLPYYTLFDWLQFEVKPEGTVVLMGQVTRPTLKSDAENVVKKVEGVEKVVNQIEVLPLSSNDDRIRRNVYRALFNYSSPLFRYSVGAMPSIHIIVKNGNVTLKGVVLSKSDSTIATVQANGVPGVFSVTNELLVENDKPE